MRLLHLLERHPDYPLAEPDELERVVEGLAVAGLADAVRELAHWYTSLRDFDGLSAADRAAIVRHLDEAGRARADELFALFYGAVHTHDRAERERRELLEEYWNALAGAYARCVADAEQAGKQGKELRAELPLLLARSYRAQFLCCRTRALQYLPAAPRDWLALYRPLAFAERARFEAEPLQLYPRERRSSVRAELAKVLTLYMAAPQDLPPEQVELLAQVIDRITMGFSWSPTPTEACASVIDLAAGEPPRLAAREEAGAESQRYFGAGAALSQLSQMEAESGHDLLEDDMRFAASFTPTQVVTVLRHLRRRLDAAPPRRAPARTAVAEPLEVVLGFAAICQRAAAMDASRPPAGGKEELAIASEVIDVAPQVWQVIDRSEWGIGAAVPAGTWPEPGMLCGVHVQGQAQWWVAMLRRVDGGTPGRLRCGLQVLSRKPVSLWLRVLGREGQEVSNWESASGSFRYDYVRALVLPDAPRIASRPVILLEGGRFVPKQMCEIMMGERSRYIKLSEFLEQGADYIRAAFEWMPTLPTRA